MESPAMVTFARIGTSLLSKPSSSTSDSPSYTPSGHPEMNWRTCRSVAFRISATTAISRLGP